MSTRRRTLRAAFLIVFLSAAVLAGIAGAVQDVQKAPAAKPAATKPAPEAAPKEIHPTFLSPREKSGTYVFICWTWLSIGVLLYVLRLKIKEADRVFLAGYYETGTGGKEPAKHP